MALCTQKQALAEAAARAPVVNSAQFLALTAKELGPDQLFFHRFFREKAERERRLGRDKPAARRGEEDGGSEEEDDDSDDDEEGGEVRGVEGWLWVGSGVLSRLGVLMSFCYT